MEYMPIGMDSNNPANFANAYRAKVKLQPSSCDTSPAGYDNLPPHQDAFAIDFKGTSPDADFVCARLVQIFKMVLPGLTMQISNHTFRRGGATCLSFMNVDSAVMEHAGGWAANSKSRPAYIAMVREQLVRNQMTMHAQRFSIVQDEMGFRLQPPTSTAATAQATTQNKSTLRAAAANIDTAMESARDTGAMESDSDDDQDRAEIADSKGEYQYSDSDEEETAKKPTKVKRRAPAQASRNQGLIKAFFAPAPEPEPQAAAAQAPVRAPAAASTQRPTKKLKTSAAAAQPRVYQPQQVFSEHPWQHPQSLAMFDSTAQTGVHVPSGLRPCCVLYNLGAWHEYEKCEFSHTVCCFCRKAGHRAVDCGYGGAQHVKAYKRGCKGPDT